MAKRRTDTLSARLWSAWRRRQERTRRQLMDTHIYRVLGERLLHDYLWVHDKRAIAGGFSLGLFVAFTPTIPFQMLIAACGALYFKVNLPIALLMCWVTNPLTAYPIYRFALRIGRYVVEKTPLISDVFDLYAFQAGMARAIILYAVYLCVGSLIISTTAALTANATVRTLWNSARFVFGVLARRRRVQQNADRRRSTSGSRGPSSLER